MISFALSLLMWQANPPPIREIEARHWFNNPVFRLDDERRVVLAVFETNDVGARRWVGVLNRLARRSDTVVIALTRDDRRNAERFVERWGVRFTVGAASTTAGQLATGRLPLFVRITRRAAEAPEPLSLDGLQQQLPDWGPYGEEDVSAITDPERLADFVCSDAYDRKRAEAVKRLAAAMTPEDFAALAAAQLPYERSPRVRGCLQHFLEISEGSRPATDPVSAARDAYRAYSRAPNTSPWATVRAAAETARTADGAALLQRYRDELGQDATQAAARVALLDAVKQRGDAMVARQLALAVLNDEEDWYLRVRLVGMLAEFAKPGDLEVAAALEAAAGQETDLLHVRPLMEYTALHLRTGEEDPRRMPTPAEATP